MSSTEPAHNYRYWAFISYSHADEAFALWLHRRLERYRVLRNLVGRPHPTGTVPRRLKPVFRDRDELSSSGNLDPKILEALQTSRYLIVICSRRSAASWHVNEEIRLFKSLGREQQVLPIILDGEPHAGKVPGREADECFPLALTQAFDAQGSPTGKPCQPLAADARPNRDGRRRALLKIIAGLLEVGFDELERRERQRQIVRLIVVGILSLSAALFAAFGYIGLSDAGVNLPGSDSVRSWLDRNKLTLFRRPYDEGSIAQRASDLRRRAISTALHRERRDGLVYYRPDKSQPELIDPWSSAQVVAGLASSPELLDQQRALLRDSLDRLFETMQRQDDEAIGWAYRVGHPPQGAILAWVVRATCRAGTSRDEASADQQWLDNKLTVLREIARHYYPIDDGGWNMYVQLQDPADHNCYVSILMLQALLAMREKNLTWDTPERRDELIARTAQFLIQNYDGENINPGWRRSKLDEDVTTFDGMTLQGYTALLQAEAAVGVELPHALLENLVRHVAGCGARGIGYEHAAAEFEHVIIESGRPLGVSEGIRFHWYPWSVACAAMWLDRPQSATAPTEKVLAVRRALGHLVMELGDKAHAGVEKLPPFAAGELLVGLSEIRP